MIKSRNQTRDSRKWQAPSGKERLSPSSPDRGEVSQKTPSGIVQASDTIALRPDAQPVKTDEPIYGDALLVNDPRAEEAWNEFFNRFDEFIHRTVAVALRRYRRYYSADEACDVVQQIYERLIENDFRALRNFRGRTERAWRAYLARICYNLVADHGRAKSKTVPVDFQIMSLANGRMDSHCQSITDPNQECGLHRRELRDLIESSLRRKGYGEHAKRDRLVFVLRYYDGYSADEVARALQLTTRNVNTIYHRVKKHITIDLAKTLGKRTAPV